MTLNGILQILLYLIVLILLVKPLGWYMAQVYEGKFRIPVLSHIENLFYRLSGVSTLCEMNWKRYLFSMLIFNLVGMLFLYLLQRSQIYLPLNPEKFSNVLPDLAFNTAASFVTNTNWQSYSGESSLSYLTQMLGMTVQNFLSAATGMALVIAFVRGLVRHETTALGNFWVDMLRTILYILLPLSLLLAIALTSAGVIQNFKPYEKINLLESFSYQQPKQTSEGIAITDEHGQVINETIVSHEQTLPMGPVASQVAIKQLGTNGGGYFNANSTHPFENPTPFSNFLEMLAILLIPAALCYTFGLMVGDTRQGGALLIVMLMIFIPFTLSTYIGEQRGNQVLTQMGIDAAPKTNLYPGGNMEGKETRFGIVNSTIWSSATTATSNGSVNSMLDSYVPIGGLFPLWLIQLGEVIFGGVGTGLSGILIFVILTVFVSGLMVGRTPEYLGKKIEPYEMKMASFAVLLMPCIVLLATAVAVCTHYGTDAITNSGPHGFTQILYAFSSYSNNNGSAFAGIQANTLFYNLIGGLAMLFGRFWIAIPTLAIAGSLVRKKTIPNGAGTLPTNTVLFIVLVACVVIVVGGLTFFPALALGPIVEQLMLWNHYVR